MPSALRLGAYGIEPLLGASVPSLCDVARTGTGVRARCWPVVLLMASSAACRSGLLLVPPLDLGSLCARATR